MAYLNDLTTVDEWEQIESQGAFIEVEPDLSDVGVGPQFREDEKDLIKINISQFRIQVIQQFAPVDETLQIIDRRLDYLAAAVDRLPRIDWKALALQTVLAISIALTLDVEQGKALFSLFKQIFTGVFLLTQ